MFIETVCVHACACVRACVCMCASGLAYVDLREENCILMHTFFLTYPATVVPTNPADASHFVTPSLFHLAENR